MRSGARPARPTIWKKRSFRIREGYQNFRLEPVETTHPDVSYRSSPRPLDLHLVYFARTLQRTQLIGHFVHRGFEVPVHYSITGAIILEARRPQVQGLERAQAAKQRAAAVSVSSATAASWNATRAIRFCTCIDSGGDRPEYTQLRIAGLRKAQEITLGLAPRAVPAVA